MIRFQTPDYPGGRHLLMCGTVAVGAVFPPSPQSVTRLTREPQASGGWQWRVWITPNGIPARGEARSLADAQAAAMREFRDFLHAARLVPGQEAAAMTDTPAPATSARS